MKSCLRLEERFAARRFVAVLGQAPRNGNDQLLQLRPRIFCVKEQTNKHATACDRRGLGRTEQISLDLWREQIMAAVRVELSSSLVRGPQNPS